MTLIDAQCSACGQEEGTFPSMREAERVLRAHGWVRQWPVEFWTGARWDAPRRTPMRWYCPHCVWTSPLAKVIATPILTCLCPPCRRRYTLWQQP